MLIAIIGASGTGKTTISREMTENLGFGEITSYTTRSMRPGEKQDVDYHFVDLDSFKKMIEENKFVEYEEYTQNRFYGTAKEDIKNATKSDKVYSVVVTPGGMRNIKSYLEKEGLTDNFKSILVTAPLGTRINRYINRQGEAEFTFDDMNEIFSRVNRDYGMFLNLEKEVDLCIENDGKKTPKELTADIIEEFKKRGIPSLLKLQLSQRFGFTSNDIHIIEESENIVNMRADKNFLHPKAKENELTGDYGTPIDKTDSEMELEIPEPFEEIEEEQSIEEDLEEGLPF